MSRETKAKGKTGGSEAAEKLRTLLARWEREEIGDGVLQEEPSWDEVTEALNEGRPEDGKPFPER